MTKPAETTNDRVQLLKKIADTRAKLLQVRLDIRAGSERNTNAHKDLKRQLAQLLTSANQK